MVVPNILSVDQNTCRKYVFVGMLERIANELNLSTSFETYKEAWGFTYNPESKLYSMKWKSPRSPRLKKAGISESKFKVMLIVFFDMNGIVMLEVILIG
ncbi:hypothetical protein TNIN_415001 [Trichonephila inaurata madagascariensis]|uniref:Uncharacterized protein n=1 Tax=Trichonephila inaurata madagascariensis TaxID=2747483 RepID=A0A8X6X3Z9_9ARAC|nr:hypothetical protein TNIN_415001 [Trichonephila inaurata madagascariensis]